MREQDAIRMRNLDEELAWLDKISRQRALSEAESDRLAQLLRSQQSRAYRQQQRHREQLRAQRHAA
jgi:hypothetical protein